MLKYLVFASSALIANAAHAIPVKTPTRPASTVPAARTGQSLARGTFVTNVDKNFRTLDTNHDGMLTLQEINGAQAQRQKTLQAQIASRRAQAFTRMDTNKDGMISQAEFNAGAPVPKISNIDAGFAKLDSNHDGKVSPDEFRSPRVARFDALDANHDGVVSSQEMRAARLTASHR